MPCELLNATRRSSLYGLSLAALLLKAAAVLKPGLLVEKQTHIQPAPEPKESGPLEYALSLSEVGGRVADHVSLSFKAAAHPSSYGAPAYLIPIGVVLAMLIFGFQHLWNRLHTSSSRNVSGHRQFSRQADSRGRTAFFAGWSSAPAQGRSPGGKAQASPSIPWRDARQAEQEPPEGRSEDQLEEESAAKFSNPVHFLSKPNFDTPPGVLGGENPAADGGEPPAAAGKPPESCKPTLREHQGNNAKLLMSGAVTLRGA